jgi:putative hydrolase of the HAD superfamily
MSGRMSTVVFDIDDTLYLERDYVRSGFDAVGTFVEAELAVSGFAAAAWSQFEAGVRGRIFDAALDECGVVASPELVTKLVDVYRCHAPAIALLADAIDCLGRAGDRATIAFLTDGPLASQRAKAEALGVQQYGALVVYTEELGAGFGKPHTRGFEDIERVTGHAGAQCTYVADNPAKDFVAPRALGWRTVRVRRAGSLHERVDSGDDVDEELRDLSSFFSAK